MLCVVWVFYFSFFSLNSLLSLSRSLSLSLSLFLSCSFLLLFCLPLFLLSSLLANKHCVKH